jgi:probable rRNA maturation factor
MITIRIQSSSHFPIDKDKIKAEIDSVLTNRLKQNAEVSISIIGDRQMKNLNTSYRKIDDTTDVLSFPQHDPSQIMHPFVMPPDDTLYLGDIVVSFPQAVDEAANDGVMVDQKIIELVLHGLDHLLGIHHPE